VNEKGGPPSGLLGGILEPPDADWGDKPLTKAATSRNAPLSADWRWSERRGAVRLHIFRLELQAASVVVKGRPLGETEGSQSTGSVRSPASLMRKVAKLAVAGAVQKRGAQ
jgi:hypothetical protein